MKFAEGIRDNIKRGVIEQMVNLLSISSDKNVVRLAALAEKLVREEKSKKAILFVKKAFEEGHPTVNVARNILTNLPENCRKKLVTNLFINSLFIGGDKRAEFERQEGFKPPYLLVISPTMRCNLNCKGCYAGGYSKEDDLEFEVIDRILNEAKEMGIYFVTISGGEPCMRKDMLKIYEKHNDMYFQIYTNGTLIDKKMAEKLAELGNAAPAISVEGFKKETDERRGKGVYKKVMKAMRNLKKAGVLFGFSATPTRYNSDLLSSEKFIDFYIKKGCYFGWYFQYIPIGKNPDVNLMATPEQRHNLYNRIREFRKIKSIFMGDFWNDGPYTEGCIAGGKKYLHINCKGDVEPCVFVHFAIDNIKNKSLREALNSPLLKKMREKQPYSENLLMPCIIIDNPHLLREVVKETNARPTHDGAETIVEDKRITEYLDNYAKRMHELTDKVWNEKYAK